MLFIFCIIIIKQSYPKMFKNPFFYQNEVQFMPQNTPFPKNFLIFWKNMEKMVAKLGIGIYTGRVEKWRLLLLENRSFIRRFWK